MTNQRKHYPPEKKVEILREHFKNRVPVGEICEKYGIKPSMFYRWEKQLFEGGGRGELIKKLKQPTIHGGLAPSHEGQGCPE